MDLGKHAKIQSYRGLISAPFTAFNFNGDVNPEILPKYVDYLVGQGVKGVFVNGTTGEGLSLTVEERKAIAQGWVDAGKNKTTPATSNYIMVPYDHVGVTRELFLHQCMTKH